MMVEWGHASWAAVVTQVLCELEGLTVNKQIRQAYRCMACQYLVVARFVLMQLVCCLMPCLTVGRCTSVLHQLRGL